MRKAPLLLLLLGTASCSGGDSGGSQDFAVREDSTEASADASTDSRSARAPGIAPTAAPGVAFNYRYAFRVAGERIGEVQEQHAAACEKLGIARCRITGMRYELVGNRDVQGLLAFKLDPTLARAFGKQGIDAVNRAEGMLVDAEISGIDVGSQIAAATRSEAELGEELKKVEAQLARPGLGSSERAELQLRAQQLRDQIRASRTTRGEQQQSLATTPMEFRYGSGDLVPGFDGRPRLRQAMEHALDNFLGGLAWIFVALITLLPWALLALIGWWIARRVAPLLRRPTAEPAATAAEG